MIRSAPSSLFLGALLLLSNAACQASLPAVPSKGGRVFHELQSAHFVLRTDVPLPGARKTLQQLERLRSAYLEIGWELSGDEPYDPLVVIMFPNAINAERQAYLRKEQFSVVEARVPAREPHEPSIRRCSDAAVSCEHAPATSTKCQAMLRSAHQAFRTR